MDDCRLSNISKLKRKILYGFLQVMVVGEVNLFSKFQMLCHLVASPRGI